MTDTTTQQNTKKSRRLTGVVTSAKMKDTVTVAVTRYVKHPRYQKFIKQVKKFHAHDAGNTKAEGEKVLIEETRPISKTKHFKVV